MNRQNNVSPARSGAPGPMTASDHRDVGIYGLWYGNNYGSMITYYALSRVIASMGLSCGMISNPLGSEPDIDALVRSHSLRFARDHYAVSPKYALNEMSRLNGMFGRFVLGSDQMWNIGLSRPYRQSYYLDFADEAHAGIAYATSFGKDVWRGTEEERLAAVSNLRRFRAVSVRDAFSREILRNQFGIDSTVVLDPVFLCPMDAYLALMDECAGRIPASCLASSAVQGTGPEDTGPSDDNQTSFAGSMEPDTAAAGIDLAGAPYLFAYILDPDVSIGAGLSQIAEETGRTIYVAFDEGRYVRREFGRVRNALALTSDRVVCLNDITVQEWLSLYAHAQFVMTDSFHGTCFSILFRKPFIVKKNGKRGGRRFDHLLSTLRLTGRMIERSDGFYDRFRADGGLSYVPDYSAAERILSSEGERCRRWLRDALLLPESQLRPVTLAPGAVTSVLEPDRCIGCGACVSICPKDALVLRPDRFGYYVPSIDYEACVNCGRCEGVCPALHLPARTNASRPECLSFIAKDPDVLYESSSGGVFPLLASKMLRGGGIVCGAAWNPSSKEDIPVRHILAGTPVEVRLLQKSKYLQSYMGNIDRLVRQELEGGRRVLFTGCPCQVAGLRSFLGKDYDNLIAVDLLCGNAPSAQFFRKYLEESFPEGVTAYQFRAKTHGWNANTVRITLSDGRELVRRGGKEDLYQKAYHSHLMCPPHCETCPYQEVPRYGDLTIGDFWGYSKKDASVDTTGGISAVLINTEKGRRYLASLPEAEILRRKAVPLEWLGGNGNALPGRHNWASPMRDEFYRQITEHSFREAVSLALSPESTAAGKEDRAQRARILQLERELRTQQERCQAAERELERIQRSRSYRFGRAVSAPLRWLRRNFRKKL